MLHPSNILNKVYAKSVIMEGELSSTEIQAAVSNNCEKLQYAFNNFQNIMTKNLPTIKSVC